MRTLILPSIIGSFRFDVVVVHCGFGAVFSGMTMLQVLRCSATRTLFSGDDPRSGLKTG